MICFHFDSSFRKNAYICEKHNPNYSLEARIILSVPIDKHIINEDMVFKINVQSSPDNSTGFSFPLRYQVSGMRL